MKTLILMRHAKSGSAKPGQSDRERGLNKRGRAEAERMGLWLTEQGHTPDSALVSGAQRTRETWQGMGLPCPSVDFRDELYLCGPETIFDAIRNAKDCERLLVLGHNPGIAEAMSQCSVTPKYFDVPPATTVVYSLVLESWDCVLPGTGRLVAFETPRTLMEK